MSLFFALVFGDTDDAKPVAFVLFLSANMMTLM